MASSRKHPRGGRAKRRQPPPVALLGADEKGAGIRLEHGHNSLIVRVGEHGVMLVMRCESRQLTIRLDAMRLVIESPDDVTVLLPQDKAKRGVGFMLTRDGVVSVQSDAIDDK